MSYKKINFILILLLQSVFLCSISLDWIGLEIPVIRQIVGFFYLTFIPGLLILGILKINTLNRLEMILYSVGLSLSFLMFVGFIMNCFFPCFGISKPISEKPLIFTITIIITLLSLIFYFKSEKFGKIITVEQLSPITLVFGLLPVIAILGAYLLKYYNDNTVILALYGVISLIPLFASLNMFPERIFPFAIWTISISLLFSVSLSVKYLTGYQSDATIEYYYANLVYTNGIWDPSIFGNQNAMLRIVMLHPIYAILLDLNLKDVFLIVHPLLYSFTPVALYLAFKRQTNEKIAFLSCFLLMSFFSFYVTFSRNTRTGLAEFFLALFILLMTDTNIKGWRKALLSIAFALSIAVSHYGTSYLFMISLVFASIFLFLVRKYKLYYNNHNYNSWNVNIISINFTLIYFVFSLSWYIYNSTGSCYETLLKFFDNMLTQIGELFSPETSYAIYALSRKWAFSIEITRDLLLFAIICIIVGMIDLIWNVLRTKKSNFQPEFTALSLAFFGVILATLLPTKEFNPARVYHLSLCFLAPFSVIGFVKMCGWLVKHLRGCLDGDEDYLKIFSVYLAIFLLFNSGFVSETLTKGNDYSPNILVSKPRAHYINDPQYIKSFYSSDLTDMDVYSAKWLTKLRDHTKKIYCDDTTGIFCSLIGPPGISHSYLYVTNKNQVQHGYIFLHTYNVARKVSITQLLPPQVRSINEVYPIEISNKIYTNGGSNIYLKE